MVPPAPTVSLRSEDNLERQLADLPGSQRIHRRRTGRSVVHFRSPDPEKDRSKYHILRPLRYAKTRCRIL
jgi:hypothetical protein